MAEQLLYHRLLHQIIDDYFVGSLFERDKSKRLIDGVGEWGDWFEFICDAVGYDSDWVRRRVSEARPHLSQRKPVWIGRMVLGEHISYATREEKDRRLFLKRSKAMGCKKKSGGGKKK